MFVYTMFCLHWLFMMLEAFLICLCTFLVVVVCLHYMLCCWCGYKLLEFCGQCWCLYVGCLRTVLLMFMCSCVCAMLMTLAHVSLVSPCFRSSHALHQSHQSERRLDDRRRHRHPHRGQLLRRAAGGLRHHAGLEWGQEKTAGSEKIWWRFCQNFSFTACVDGCKFFLHGSEGLWVVFDLQLKEHEWGSGPSGESLTFGPIRTKSKSEDRVLFIKFLI